MDHRGEGKGETAEGPDTISPSWWSETADLGEWCRRKTTCPDGIQDLHKIFKSLCPCRGPDSKPWWINGCFRYISFAGLVESQKCSNDSLLLWNITGHDYPHRIATGLRATLPDSTRAGTYLSCTQEKRWTDCPERVTVVLESLRTLGYKSNQIKSNQIKSNQIKSNQIKSGNQ